MKYHLVSAMVFVLMANTAFAQTPPPMVRAINVSGEATEQVEPDRAILNVSLVSRNKDLNAAKEANDKLTEQVVASLREFKIPKEKIANSYMHISPEYRYENNKQTLIGYIVNRSLMITMDDITIHERVLSSLVALKVDHVGGVEFTLKDREAQADRVRAKAYENARNRAVTIAKAAGVTLGKPINISVSGGYSPPMPMPMARGMMAMEGKAADSVAPSLPGLITLSESVNVVFEME